ncbi:hypothetical protein ACWIYZ_04495 [Ursidibacter arcticus]
MSQNLQLLGWGIVGTPKGRQQVDDGVNKQSKVSFELSQEFGSCLPSPNQSSNDVLYCLSSKALDKYWQLGLAEYHSIFEQGQTRAGTYFGAYINVINATFGEDNLDKLFAKVRSLSIFQYTRFIDANSRSYKESINGKSIPPQEAELTIIADSLQPLPPNVLKASPKETLFIFCQTEQVVETLKHILTTRLYYQYKQIFFSDSEFISSQMKKKKIDFMSSNELMGLRISVPLYEQRLINEITEKKQVMSELQKTKQNQEIHIKQEVNNRVEEYKQKSQQEIQSYSQRAEQAVQEQKRLAEQLQSAEFLAKLGHTIVNAVANNAEALGKANLAQFADRELEKKVADMQISINMLPAKLAQQQRPAEVSYSTVESNDSGIYRIFTFIFAGTSILFLLMAIWGFFFNDPSKEEIKKSQEYQQLEKQKSESDKEKTKLEEKLNKLEKVEKENETLNKFKQEICQDKKVRDHKSCKEN